MVYRQVLNSCSAESILVKTHSCAEKPDSEIFRSLHGRFCSLTFKTTCQRSRLQLACGMAVSFIYSRLSAFTRVYSASGLYGTAIKQSKCLSVSGRPWLRVRGTHLSADSAHSLSCLRHGGRFRQTQSGSFSLVFEMSRQQVICVLLGSLCPAGKWNRS